MIMSIVIDPYPKWWSNEKRACISHNLCFVFFRSRKHLFNLTLNQIDSILWPHFQTKLCYSLQL